MTPFLQFRIWLRQGPTSERVAATLAAMLAMALLVWSAVPVRDRQTTVDAGIARAGATIEDGAPNDPASRSTAAASSDGTSAGVGADAGTASRPAGSAAAGSGEGGQTAADRCAGLRANDQGITDTEVFVAVPYISLAGEAGNSTFGLRSPEEIEAAGHAYVDAINQSGGVACRTLRVEMFEVNPLNPVEQESRCREIIGRRPYAIVDNGGFITPVSRQCFLDAEIPYQGAVSMSEKQAADSYPYLYAVKASADRAARSFVIEAGSRGWFDPKKGFSKLGVLLDGCHPQINRELIENLNNVGVSKDKMSVFTYSGCASLNPPSETGAAVAQHRRDGASHVLLAGNGSNGQQYVRQADAIAFTPVYLTSDFEEQTNPTLAAQWPAGFDGAMAITSLRAGERNSGIVAPAVKLCNEWLTAAGLAPSETEEDQSPLALCDQIRLFAAAANSAGPGLTRPTLVDRGLANVGRFEGAANATVNIYDRPRKVTGGDFIRAIQWHADCTCWKIVDKELKPGH